MKHVDAKDFKILVVDDHSDLNALTCEYLNDLGFSVTGEINPENVLNLINNTTYNLILLDITMPKISGIDILKSVRKMKSSIELPVIMLTSRSENELIVQALELGANDYISKPVNLPVLKSRIQTQLLIAQQARELRSAQTYKTIQTMLASFDSKIEKPLDLIKRVLEKIKSESPELVKNIDRLLHLIDLTSKNTEK